MRNRNYDIIRVTATLMVICIHSMRPLRESIISGALALDNWICAIYYAIIGAGVPMFFMLSGALLIGKDENPLSFYRKRFPRILIPFTIWSVIVYLLNWIMDGANWQYLFPDFLSRFFSLSGVNEAYWFVYVLLFLYLITPLLAMIRRRSRYPVAWLVVLFITYVLLRVGAFNNDAFILPARWMSFLLLYVLGFVLRDERGKGTVLAALVVITMTIQVLSRVLGCMMYLPWELISAIALFGCLNSLPERDKSVCEDVIDFIGRTNYGIYLSHVIVCGALVRLTDSIDFLPLPFLPLVITTVVIIIEYMMMKICERLHLDGVLY